MKNNFSQKKPRIQKGTLGRVIKSVFRFYPKMLTVALVCIVFNAVVSSLPSLFMQTVFGALKDAVSRNQTWAEAWRSITVPMCTLIGLYVLSLVSGALNKQLMAVITQGYLSKMRERMFNGMQDLPIRYFDTHTHGDIMSYYTNDIDSLRQVVAESMPQLLTSAIMVLTLFIIMLYYSLWLTLIVFGGILFVVFVTKVVGGGAAKYFIGQQRAVAKCEGFIEEMMNGQKVVKSFCHEEEAKRDFDKVNEHLFDQTNRANRYANMLMPILGNIGHVLYVVIALVGATFILGQVKNVSFSGSVFFELQGGVLSTGAGIVLLVAFLQTTRQFFNNINQVSQQINSVVMGLAGASRIISLIDEEKETDEGYVTLVNAKEVNGELVECEEHTGIWAWRHPHQADGTVTYTRLEGDVRMFDVDFGYTEDKIVLHDVSLYARPGEKVAFVGATGAGKTTITNLLTRFYDIADGKIRYDGININKIKKSALRKSLGM
ncbi:MAG: ABC transporter ATP-binding protein, partial [Candidatus Gallimonas sp.]